MKFEIIKKLDGTLARAGIITTSHGEILTPSFVPVGTKATVKGILPEMLAELGAQVALANTYHLYLQPGDEIVRDAGGLHKFMNWEKPIITDSGGFQVFSLGAAYGKELSKVVKGTDVTEQIPARSSADDGVPRLATIGNDGVSFRSHIDGSLHYITPEKSMQIQHNLGADIIFAFDECTSPSEDFRYQDEALSRTHAWAKRSLEEHKRLLDSQRNHFSKVLGSPAGSTRLSQNDSSASPALFGIVQGGRDETLRKKSAEFIGSLELAPNHDGGVGLGFDGYGIGGSFAKEDMETAVKWVNEILPENKPRHLLGIGEPEDLFMGVENGVDLFDCVAPTRNARNGTLYTKNGKINMMNTKFQNDFGPIEIDCECYVCTSPQPSPARRGGQVLSPLQEKAEDEVDSSRYSRAYISHLFRAKEMLAGTLATIHNLYFINKLVADMRQAILEGNFLEFKNEFLKNYAK